MKPYYEHAGITIFHGDCLEVLSKLEPVDVVLTDPPYSEHVHSKSRMGSKRSTNDKENRHRDGIARVKELGFDAITPEMREKVADHFAILSRRWVLVFSDVESAHLWRGELTVGGLEYIRTGAWVKLGATPQFTGDRPAAGFEAITIAHPKGKKRWNGGGTHALWSYPIVLNRSHSDPRLHTTQKPLPLIGKLVSLFSDPGETILDPFMGSGTTLHAAKNLGRKAIGIELEERYCEVAARRLQQEMLELEPSAAGGER